MMKIKSEIKTEMGTIRAMMMMMMMMTTTTTKKTMMKTTDRGKSVDERISK